MEDYTLQKKAGQGAQGVVFKATERRTGTTVAVKQIDISTLSAKERNAALAEVKVLETLRDDPHPCIMGYRTSFIHEENLCMVLDWCDSGTLQDVVDNNKEMGSTLSEEFLWAAAISLLSALEHLHSRGILHRDVKLANIFLSRDPDRLLPRFHLGDFGVSCVLDDRTRARTVVGTPYYLSPEVCCGTPYDSKSDIWSFGVAFYQLLNDRLPFEASNYAALIMRIVQSKADAHTRRYAPFLHSLATKCMRKAAGSRPTATELLMESEMQTFALKLELLQLSAACSSSAEAIRPSSVSTLPIKRAATGAVPSRRIRNRNRGHPGASQPVAPAQLSVHPARLSTSARRQRPSGAVAPADSRPVAESGKVADSPLMTDAARRRAAAAVAELPSYGSEDSDDGREPQTGQQSIEGTKPRGSMVCQPVADAGHSPTVSEGETDDQPFSSPVLSRDGYERSTMEANVTWRVDGEAGQSNAGVLDNVPDSPHVSDHGASEGGPAPDASVSATLVSTATTYEPTAEQLAEVQDAAEQLTDAATFLSLVDALQHEDTIDRFEGLVERLDPPVADELVYLAYKYVFLTGADAS